MADVTVIYWRDIPAQVLVGSGRRAVKHPLSKRFEEAIDRAAMRSGAAGTDEYLAEWRKVAEPARGPDAPAHAAALESAWPDERLRAVAQAGGREAG